MRSLAYFFKESLQGFTRNLSTALGSIVTIFLSLLIIGVFLVGACIVNNLVSSIEDEVSITAYVADDAQQSDIDSLMNSIKGIEGVASVSFTTKDQALENFRNSMTSNPDVLDQLVVFCCKFGIVIVLDDADDTLALELTGGHMLRRDLGNEVFLLVLHHFDNAALFVLASVVGRADGIHVDQ